MRHAYLLGVKFTICADCGAIKKFQCLYDRAGTVLVLVMRSTARVSGWRWHAVGLVESTRLTSHLANDKLHEFIIRERL